MIKFLDTDFDGDSWEELCQKCFRLKYADDGYQMIPADFGGDLGIEGYTRSGIVFQCYCPEQDYPPKELYEHQRDKITRDINKLVQNGKDLMGILGKIKIKKWYFVTPFYNNKELLKHCNDKKEYVLKVKATNNLDYIDDSFDVLIMVSDDLKTEVSTVIKLYEPHKLSIPIKFEISNRDWRECKSPLVENLIRKISAVVPNSESEVGRKNVDAVVRIYMEFYLNGIKAINLLETKYPDFYEKLIELKDICENDVAVRCCMNGVGVENNRLLFDSIIKDFKDQIINQFGDIMDLYTVEELKNQIISSWLLHCPMDFR